MIFIDVYDDENGKLIRSFDIETHKDWIEYLDWWEMQVSMGRWMHEITRYQQED